MLPCAGGTMFENAGGEGEINMVYGAGAFSAASRRDDLQEKVVPRAPVNTRVLGRGSRNNSHRKPTLCRHNGADKRLMWLHTQTNVCVAKAELNFRDPVSPRPGRPHHGHPEKPQRVLLHRLPERRTSLI